MSEEKTDLIVERSYSHPFLNEPKLFYYHKVCWARSAPPDLAFLAEGRVYESPRGTVHLVRMPDVPPGERCQQCNEVFT
jgi:hypothetical protein